MKRPDAKDELLLRMRTATTQESVQELRAAWIQAGFSSPEFDLEFALTTSLRDLPNQPVSSNFTSRVLQSVQTDATTAAARSRTRSRLRLPLPAWLRLSAAASLLALSLVLLHQHDRKQEQAQRAETVATVSQSLPPLDLLQDFEPILQLKHAPSNEEIDFLLVALP